MSDDRHIVILGAGPAGVGAAYRLAQSNVRATVLERNNAVGGLAGSFEVSGVRVDFGSHRLHPACEEHVMRDIKALLGDDLLLQPRHGRIRLRGRWIHFPLKPVDLLCSLPPSFAMGVLRDTLGKPFRKAGAQAGEESFASVLMQGLGPTICHDFYFPYAGKIWGLDPTELSATQAKRRVGASSPARMIRKILTAVPGFKSPTSGRFYYPRQSFGQICEAYHRAASQAGASFEFGATVESLQRNNHGGWRVTYRRNTDPWTIDASEVWSTIPLTTLVRLLQPAPPEQVLRAANQLQFRSMLLIYLVIAQPRFTEFDAHYFPESSVPLTRMSEPKNYASRSEPSDRTVLCVELPCSGQDAYWSMSDDELSKLVQQSLEQMGIAIRVPVLEVTTRRLPQAYPIYTRDYDEHFRGLDDFLATVPDMLTFGRQGLFAHDNTHHTLAMAYAAVNCLTSDGFDHARWAEYRTAFASHVVED